MSFRIFVLVALAAVFPAAVVTADCGSLATAKEVLDCVLRSDPGILASAERVKRSEALARAAGAWNNPEVEGEYLRSDTGSGEKISASLTQRIEWGSGAKAANLEWEAAQAEHRSLRQEVLGRTVLRLARLGQIEEEARLIEGQSRLCDRGLERFQRLAFLTSEQKASRNALDWGRERLGLEKLELETEAKGIRQELSLSLDGSQVPEGMALAHKTQWPAFPDASKATPSILSASNKRREAALAEAERQGDSAWPSLSLGPVFEREGDGALSRDFYGGRLSLGLPLFDRNDGGREAAEASAREQAVLSASAERRLVMARKTLRESYERAIERLEKLEPKIEEGEAKLSSIRTDYLEGRVSLPLVLEAFREMEELLKGFHSIERAAYEALWKGYALEDVAEGQEP